MPCQSQYTIKGKVTDAATGEALPYVVVQYKGSNVGAQTDFEGNYVIKTSFIKDSLKATYVGYRVRTRPLKDVPEQIVNFQLKEAVTELGEIKVKPGENPAWEIIRRSVSNKHKHTKDALNAYEYESYVKMQIDLDQISQKVRQKRAMRTIIAAIDSMKKVNSDEGKPVIPIYISETISKIYYRTNPSQKKEEVTASKITGVLDQSNGTFITQIAGSTFTEFNFYDNWMRFLGKDFVSPIADSWRDYYVYDLADSILLDADFCYKIDVQPKRKADLAFYGTIYITKNEYALKRVELATNKGTNINFVERIKIQQEMERTPTGPWIPKKVRFLVDLADIGDSTAGMLVKFYISNKNIEVNTPKDITFFNQRIEVDEDAAFKKEDYWTKARHDSLNEQDLAVYKMVDTIRKLPVVRTYIEVVDIVINGHKKVGWIEFGRYLDVVAWNTVEGLRVKLGFRTNMKMHRRLQFKGFAGIGTNDAVFKYGLGFDYWFSKKKWFLIGAEHNFDIDQVALITNYRSPGSGLFYTFARWGNLTGRSPFYYTTSTLYSQVDYLKGCTQKVLLNYQFIDNVNNVVNDPTIYRDEFNFGYYEQPGNPASPVRSNLTIAEMQFESRFAKNETYLVVDHRRVSLGAENRPIVTLRYTLGLANVLGSNFDYHKISLNIWHRITVGRFGQSVYALNADYIPYTLPYPLLRVHLGNPTPVYNPVGFSKMNFFEFVSDKCVSINYQHHFNGLFFNRVPLFYKLKWREVVSVNAIWGTASDANLNSVMPNDTLTSGIRKYRNFRSLDPAIPYLDIGAGIENIFKFIRVEVYHRLTYLDYQSNDIFIKVGAQISL
ncbi:MAG: DUF5686 family protein [Cytophagales bacterium]|nr:DUF5686 family protein [Cytophagales bacterium]